MAKNKNKGQKPQGAPQAHAPKEQAPEAKAHKQEAPKQEAPKESKPNVTTNPLKIQWPTDQWGFTREFRHAVAVMGTNLRGDPAKLAVMEKTLEVALAYLEAKYAEDKALRDKRLAVVNGTEPKPAPKAPEKEPEKEPESEVEVEVEEDEEPVEDEESEGDELPEADTEDNKMFEDDEP